MTALKKPTLTLSCGSEITLDERELAAWTLLTPESRWEIMQFSPTIAHIVLSAELAEPKPAAVDDTGAWWASINADAAFQAANGA